MNRHAVLILLMLLCAAQMLADTPVPRRRASAVTTAAAVTQAVNETRDDTARVRARRLAQSVVHYHADDGHVVYLDTITGTEWTDSALITNIPRMRQPLWCGLSVGVDIFDPLMRAFGQKYGLVGFSIAANLHNRYIPTFDIGLGQAKDTPPTQNYTYTSPMSVYFKIGADYNFLYNSNPDYQFVASARYGISAFSFTVTDVTVTNPYWHEDAVFNIPTQHPLYGWAEIGLGLRVRLWGPLSAGWRFCYHTVLHHNTLPHGQPWYIPGYGSRTSSLSAGFSFFLNIGRAKSIVNTN